jgi:hypothetical protein
MDLESRRRWEDYTKAKEAMLERTHIDEAPWWIVPADDKKKARLNCIHHLLAQMDYREIERMPVVLPPRERHDDYVRQPVPIPSRKLPGTPCIKPQSRTSATGLAPKSGRSR